MPNDVSAEHRRTPSIYNIANALTLVRLALIPVFVWVAVESRFESSGFLMVAAGIFMLASATDFVDGWLARRRGLITAFGKIADPIADKLLIGSALILLSVWEQLPWWITGVILFREIGITVLRFWVIRLGIIAASHGGKIKTVLQIAGIFWYLWPFPDPIAVVGPWLMGAAVLATVITGAEYVVQVVSLRRRASRRS